MFGGLYVSERSSGVVGLTRSHGNCILCSLILCNLLKSFNCRRYLTGSIFALPFLKSPKCQLFTYPVFSQAKPGADKAIVII